MSPFRLAGGRNAVAWRGERGPVGEQQESGQAPSQHFSEEWPWDWHVEVEQSAPTLSRPPPPLSPRAPRVRRGRRRKPTYPCTGGHR